MNYQYIVNIYLNIGNMSWNSASCDCNMINIIICNKWCDHGVPIIKYNWF